MRRKRREPACRHGDIVMLLYMAIEGGHRSVHWCAHCGAIRESHYAQRRDRVISTWRKPRPPAVRP